MGVGSDFKPVLPSYVAYSKETTYGTYASATTAVEAISCNFKIEVDSKKLDALGNHRGFSKRVQLNKNVKGSMETYLHPVESALLLIVALGGGKATTPGSTGVYIHSITAGNFDTAPSSLSFNVRKGASFPFRYAGGRVNSVKITAKVGEPVKCAWEMIFQDGSLGSDDIGTTLSVSSQLPMTFANGVFRYSSTEALANTTSAKEPIQAFELTIKNNLIDGESARELGQNTISVLPATRREIELSITQRFDTTTAFNRFLQATIGSVELFFRGPDALSATKFTEFYFRLPKVYQNTNDPMLDSGTKILESTFTFDVVVDNPNTTTGKDIGITVQNGVSTY